MLTYYVKRSRGEMFDKVVNPPKDNVRVHGDMVEAADLDQIVQLYHFDRNILRDVLDKNELPRVEMRDDGLYVFVRTVQRAKRGLVITTPVLLAVKGTVFVNISTATLSEHDLLAPNKFVQPFDTFSLLLGTFAAIVNEYELLMQRTARYIFDTGRRLRTHEVTNDDFVKFVTVEDNLNEYRMNLSSMLVVTERLRETLSESDDTEAVEDIRLYIRQLLVATDSYNQSITSIRNAYGTIANNVLNRRMKILTVLTLLVALPNVFYGMYGMNVSLPFQNEPWAYPAVIGVSFLVVFLVYALAKRFKVL
jgi:magnesium transporter